MKTYLLAMTYGPILPMAYVMTTLSFVAEYWVNKYVLLRRNAKLGRIGKRLDEIMLDVIVIGILMNCLSSMFFYYEYSGNESFPATITGFATAVGFLVLKAPLDRFIAYRRQLKNFRKSAFGSERS